MLRRRQALTEDVHDLRAVALEQGLGVQPEAWEDP